MLRITCSVFIFYVGHCRNPPVAQVGVEVNVESVKTVDVDVKK